MYYTCGIVISSTDDNILFLKMFENIFAEQTERKNEIANENRRIKIIT